MAQNTSIPGFPVNFVANTPAVAQNTSIPGHRQNHLEQLIAVVVTNAVSYPVPGHPHG